MQKDTRLRVTINLGFGFLPLISYFLFPFSTCMFVCGFSLCQFLGSIKRQIQSRGEPWITKKN